MRSLQVRLSDRSYSILIGRDLLSQAGKLIKERLPEHRCALVVTQKEIALYYLAPLLENLAAQGFETAAFITPASKSSEAAKTQAVYSKLIKKMASLDGKGKALFLVALGGGVIGDLTGFAAAVYRRGIPFVQIPTTLTAQVDSAIGGKTGIDLPEGKNLLGCVYQPMLVLSDLSLLNSLSERHWSDGFAEVIKYGVIKDPSLFQLLEKNGKAGIRRNAKLLENVIHDCARIKAKIVEQDEFDKKDLRIVLNFGHTAGHAIEAASSFSRAYTHGEAVGIGMLVACDIASQMGILKDQTLTTRLEKTLMKFELPLLFRAITVEQILKAVGYDKKNASGKNRFVLPVALGKTTLVRDIPASVITEALVKRKG